MNVEYALIWVFVWCTLGYLLSKANHVCPTSGIIWSFLFGPLGLIIILCLSPVASQKRLVRPFMRTNCLVCGESISIKAKKCRFCGAMIENRRTR